MKFPYQRPTNFNYDLKATLITDKKKTWKFDNETIKTPCLYIDCKSSVHLLLSPKTMPPGITLTESQTNVSLTKTDVYRGAKSAPGVRGRSVRERQIHKGAGVTGDMDFINSIYRKGMWELLSVLCLGRGSLCFWKWSYRIFVSAGVGKGGVENWCFYLIVDFVMLVIFVEF